MHRKLYLRCLLGLAALLPACHERTHEAGADGKGAPVALPPGAPADTAYLIEGFPITRSEVDAWLPHYRAIEPVKSDHALRRLIITNQFLPRAVGHVITPPEEIEAARRQAHEARERLERGEELPLEYGPALVRIHGHWQSEVGLDGWGTARDLPQGELSEVFEGVGSFRIIRRVASPDPADWVGNTEATIEHVTVYYIPPEDVKRVINDAYGNVDIRIVDRTWERYLPEVYLHAPE